MNKNDFLVIGKVVGVHGIRGNIKVYSYAESPSVFKPDSRILVRNTSGLEKRYTVTQAAPHKRIIRLSLKEIVSREDAEMLVGSELLIEKQDLPELDDGTYYWFDIIGLDVFTIDETYIGRVESIITTGSNDVYVVKDPDKRKKDEILIPALETVVLEIDLKNKTMQVDLPEGLA